MRKYFLVLGCIIALFVAGSVIYFIFQERSSRSVDVETERILDGITHVMEHVTEERAQGRQAPPGMHEYRGGYRYGFSLFYPEELSVEEYDGWGGTRTIVFQDTKNGTGFQIYIVNYAESQILEERFKNDVPSGVRAHESTIDVDGEVATTFESIDERLGETREIWFIHNGRLFEVTTLTSLDTWFNEIMKTWKFL